MNGERKTQEVPWQPLIAELVGTALLVLVGRIEVAKVYHFESDRRRLFRTITSE